MYGHTEGVVIKISLPFVGITNNQNKLPEGFVLFQNYPNPFNPVTNIKFEIPAYNQNITAFIKIFDISGREIQTIDNFAVKIRNK